jgi:hypothetical protein
VVYHCLISGGKDTTKSRNRQTISAIFIKSPLNFLLFLCFGREIQAIEQSCYRSEEDTEEDGAASATPLFPFSHIMHNHQCKDDENNDQTNPKKLHIRILYVLPVKKCGCKGTKFSLHRARSRQ